MIFHKWRVLFTVNFLLGGILLLSCGGGDKETQQSKSSTQKKQSASTQTAGLKPGDAEKGETLYVQYCSACHAQDATGIKGLGKNLITSQFVEEKTDKELLKYVNEGRPADHPLNTTGIAMPPKGGNPALKDQEIMHIIEYLRTLPKQ